MIHFSPRILLIFPAISTWFLLACGLPAGPGDPSPPFRAYFVDVGQGDACLLRTPGGRYHLYDLGNRDERLLPFLRRMGVDTLESVFISHPDWDHFGSFAAVFPAIPVKRIHLPPGASTLPAWGEMLTALDVSRVPSDTLYAGDTLLWEGPVRIRVLWPPKHRTLEGNKMSLVLRVEHATHALLLTGDAEAEAEAEILTRDDPAGDILKVGHHGSRTSSTLPFLAAVDPAYAVISCDSAVYGHPHAETLAGLRLIMGGDEGTLRTDIEGTIAFEIDAYGVRRIDPP